MSASSKPTIALIPGSFSTTAAYSKLITQLTTLQYPVVRIELKSVGGPEPATSVDDATHINSVLSPLVDDGKDVVIVMHSYGGIPGTDGVKGLAKADRKEAGKAGGVIGLVYVAALMVQPGASLNSTRGADGGGELPEWLSFEEGFMKLETKMAARTTLSDLPEEEADKWTSIFEKHSIASFGTELQYPAYRYVPSWYILAENDLIVEPELQQKMIDAAREGNEVEIKVLKIQSGHAPIITQTEEVVKVIQNAAGETS